MNLDEKKYDLILVIEYFRSVAYYLSIIKYLSTDLKIGLLEVPFDDNLKNKHRITQKKFVDLCISFGGEVVQGNAIQTDLLMIPQRPFNYGARQLISTVNCDMKIGVLAFAWAGIAEHDKFFDFFNIDLVFVIDREFFYYLLKHREPGQLTYQQKKIIETGLPFIKYPVFEKIFVDYMIAMPTAFSFPHESDKWLFMESVLSLLASIDREDIVVLKAHNGMDRDQFSRPRHRWLASILGVVPGFENIIFWLAHSLKNVKVGRFLGRVYTSYLYEKVLKRALPFSDLTDYYQISMEVFLPNIRKGVIGGLSNIIWGTLFAKIPYYNCANMAIQHRDSDDRLYGKKDPSKLLDLNLGYFHVPFCHGKLDFAPKHYQILNDSTRGADMITEIISLLRENE
jgi:hypothetical protein